mmetsp:Transcript_101141/g.241089  ORF Transcript_101141/g.241089 Transcript_101141/m.241089 type:complete len:274 (-) Transcript_101141:88-909(-)
MFSLAQEVRDDEGSIAGHVEDAKLFGGPGGHVNGHRRLLVRLQHHLRRGHILIPRAGDLVHLWACLRTKCERRDGLGPTGFQNLRRTRALRGIYDLWDNAAIFSRGRSKHDLLAPGEFGWGRQHVRCGRQHSRAAWDVETHSLYWNCHSSALHPRHRLNSEWLLLLLCFVEAPDVVVGGVQGSGNFWIDLWPRSARHIDDQVFRRERCTIKLFCILGHGFVFPGPDLLDDGLNPALGQTQVNLWSEVEGGTGLQGNLSVFNEANAERQFAIAV